MSCAARGNECVAQTTSPVSARTHSTAKARIGRLENELTTLTALVAEQQSSAAVAGADVSTRDNSLKGSKIAVHEDLDLEDENPPAHLQLLFKDIADIRQDDRHDRQAKQNRGPSKAPIESLHVARDRLQRILPTKEQVELIAPHASAWMSLYFALFPAANAICDGDQFTSKYDSISTTNVRPESVASYLLTTAITVLQLAPDRVYSIFDGGAGSPSFVDDVCTLVEVEIVSNNALASTLQGLETMLLLVRL